MFSFQIAHRLAAIENIDPEPVVVKFFGIFFFFFQCNSIVGNIISTTGRFLSHHRGIIPTLLSVLLQPGHELLHH